jgi:hypothetical protein
MGKVHAFHKSLFCHWLILIAHYQFCYMLMEQKEWSVHFDMEESQKPVQNQKKKRSRSDKIGRLKYNQQLLKQTLSEVEEVKLMLRTIFAGLKGSFNFDQSLIERVACADEVDREIIALLFEVGSSGLLPKDLKVRLEHFRVTRFQVSRRIVRMNKRLRFELGEFLFEKRGHKWAVTKFGFDVWGKSEMEVEEKTIGEQNE